MTKEASSQSRVKEEDLYLPALKIVNQKPGGFITTADLIIELTAEFKPQGEDAEILHNRADSKFSQLVRNIVSHRSSSKKNLVSLGLVTYSKDKRGITITSEGKNYILEHS